jgi:hypothetical protein
MPPFSMYFLALSHAPPALAMNSDSEAPTASAPAKAPASAAGPTEKPMSTGPSTATRPGRIIWRSAALVAMSTMAFGCGLGSAFPQARDGVELALDLEHDGAGRLAHRQHGGRADDERHHRADQDADQDLRRVEGELQAERSAAEAVRSLARVVDLEAIGREQRDHREGGRADGEALADGGGGVAHGVELVRDLADLGVEPDISAMPPALSEMGP